MILYNEGKLKENNPLLFFLLLRSHTKKLKIRQGSYLINGRREDTSTHIKSLFWEIQRDRKKNKPDGFTRLLSRKLKRKCFFFNF